MYTTKRFLVDIITAGKTYLTGGNNSQGTKIRRIMNQGHILADTLHTEDNIYD